MSHESTLLGGGANGLRPSDAGTLHGQIYRELSERITSGRAKPGDRMPTEAELTSTYGVSRTTARRALDDLRRIGLVERAPGRGTFVAHPRVAAPIPHLHSLTAEVEALGFRAGSVQLGLEEGVAGDELASQLRLAAQDAVLFFRRLRTANEQPFFVARSAINVTRFPELRSIDFSSPSLSLLESYERLTGRRPARATQWVSATAAGSAVAEALGCRTGEPTLLFERVLYLDGDVPVEHVSAHFRTSYKYYTEMVAAPRP